MNKASIIQRTFSTCTTFCMYTFNTFSFSSHQRRIGICVCVSYSKFYSCDCFIYMAPIKWTIWLAIQLFIELHEFFFVKANSQHLFILDLPCRWMCRVLFYNLNKRLTNNGATKHSSGRERERMAKKNGMKEKWA